MDDLSFLTEKLRRELQEVINELDELSTCANEPGPQRGKQSAVLAARLFVVGMTVKDFMKVALEVASSEAEVGDE